jgi:pyruvate dehydrogenase E2 component (dihydrolipoamide acetyltransferase)
MNKRQRQNDRFADCRADGGGKRHRSEINSRFGSGGRIIKRDIEAACKAVSKKPAATATQPKSNTQDRAEFRASAKFRARRVSAKKTLRKCGRSSRSVWQSIGPIPTFYLTVEIEMDKALEFRKQINASAQEEEKVSVNDVIVKVAAMALTKHPFVNSSYQDKTIRFYEDADIGVAVAIEDGLITPVVRGANRKGIAEISREIKEMAGRAREKKLQPEEYTGATFSISNLGNVRHRAIYGDHQSARSRDSSRSAAPRRKPLCATAKSSSQRDERHDELRPPRH